MPDRLVDIKCNGNQIQRYVAIVLINIVIAISVLRLSAGSIECLAFELYRSKNANLFGMIDTVTTWYIISLVYSRLAVQTPAFFKVSGILFIS